MHKQPAQFRRIKIAVPKCKNTYPRENNIPILESLTILFFKKIHVWYCAKLCKKSHFDKCTHAYICYKASDAEMSYKVFQFENEDLKETEKVRLVHLLSSDTIFGLNAWYLKSCKPVDTPTSDGLSI